MTKTTSMKKLIPFFISILSFSFTNAQQWEYLTPLKLSSEVHGISFLNSQEGMMTNNIDSRIYRTVNGGTNWSLVWTAAITSNFYGIDWVSPDTIFVTGSNGDLFRSIDAGGSWTELTSSTINWLYDIKFFDTQNGVAVGNLGTIVRTQDGGNTWSVIASNTTNRLVDIFMLDATHWYIIGWGGSVLQSSDMGATWTALNTAVTTNFTSGHWLSANVGFVCGAGNSIYKTTNGGSTWTLQTANVNLSSLNHIEFKDNLNGYAVGSLGSYYSTTNGGNTWTVNTPLVNKDLFVGTYVEGLGAVVGGKGTMYRSNTNLGSWSQTTSGTPRMIVKGIDFLDDNTGTIVGYVGAAGSNSNQMGIVQTQDGGKSWLIRAQGTSGGYYDVHFPTSQVGYVVGGQTLAKTTNGGVNWTYTTPVPNTNNASVWFNDANTGFIGHSIMNSGISKTTNGGTSFITSSNFVAEEIYFVNSQVGWAMPANSTTMYKTVDGGNTWDYWTTPGTQSGLSIFFLDENIGWVGSLAGVNRTLDGGLTWENTFINSNVMAIHFFSSTSGYCVTSDGDLYNTVDGGITWTIVSLGSLIIPPVNCAAFSDNYCYVGSSGGEVYRIELGCGGVNTGNIYGDLQWCENQSGYLAIPQIANAVSYDWSFPNGWTYDTNDHDEYITAVAGATDGIVSVTVTNICGESAISQVAVNVLIHVQEITQANVPAVICSEAATISIDEDPNATEYNWTWTSQLNATPNGNELFIDEASTSGTAFVQTSNSCGVSNTFEIPIVIAQNPNTTFEIVDDEVCQQGTYPLVDGTPAGGSYSGPFISQNAINTNLGGGLTEFYITYSYYTAPGCGASITDTLFVLESTIAQEVIIGDTLFCLNANANFSLSNELQYHDILWDYPISWNVETIDNTISVSNIQEEGIISVSYTNECNQSETIEQFIYLVPPFTDPITYSIDNTAWCSNSTATISFNSNYNFELSDGLNYIMDDLGTLELMGNSGNYSISLWEENECYSSDTTVVNLSILEVPVVTLDIGPDTLCGNELNLVTVSPANGVLSGDYSDGLLVSWDQMIGNDGMYYYTYTFESPNGCSANANDSVYFTLCFSVEENLANTINIYPVPGNEWINISSLNGPIESIKIINSMGSIIQSNQPRMMVYTWKTLDLAAGIYLITVTTESGFESTQRVIIEH